jgi:hypothetical protein
MQQLAHYRGFLKVPTEPGQDNIADARRQIFASPNPNVCFHPNQSFKGLDF